MTASVAAVELLWLPLGAGPGSGPVRVSGRAFEGMAAARGHRTRRALLHTALRVVVDGVPTVVEMTPDWSPAHRERQVVVRGPVAFAWCGRSRLMRYEVHRWRDGSVVDESSAIGGPRRVGEDREKACRLLDLLPDFPALTWGRDQSGAGDMWCSNSLTSWALSLSGHDMDAVLLPDGARAPGWAAGLRAADGLPRIGSGVRMSPGPGTRS